MTMITKGQWQPLRINDLNNDNVDNNNTMTMKGAANHQPLKTDDLNNDNDDDSNDNERCSKPPASQNWWFE